MPKYLMQITDTIVYEPVSVEAESWEAARIVAEGLEKLRQAEVWREIDKLSDMHEGAE